MSHLRWVPHADLILMAEGPNALLATIKGAGVTLNFTALRESVDAIAERVRRAGNVPNFRPAQPTVAGARGHCDRPQWVPAQFHRTPARIHGWRRVNEPSRGTTQRNHLKLIAQEMRSHVRTVMVFSLSFPAHARYGAQCGSHVATAGPRKPGCACCIKAQCRRRGPGHGHRALRC